MSHSLQDQLLKAGLVDEKSAKRTAKEKRKKRRQQKSGPPQAETPAPGLRQAEERARRDKNLNRQRIEAQRARELDAQVRQMIESHRVPMEAGDTGYNFVDGSKVKRLYVSESLHSRITKGRIAIVGIDGEYSLVPADTALKIQARASERVLVLNVGGEEQVDDGDPYGDYKVPDDLTW